MESISDWNVVLIEKMNQMLATTFKKDTYVAETTPAQAVDGAS